jgi:predicted esterase
MLTHSSTVRFYQRTAISENSKDTPLLMCHGTADNVVRYEWGQKSFNLLKSGA